MSILHHYLIERSWSSFLCGSRSRLWIPWTCWKLHLCFSWSKSMSSYKIHEWKKHSIHTCLENLMTMVHIHRSGWFPRFLFLCFHYLEISFLCSFLSHIICRILHVLLEFMEDLQQLCLQVVVLCSAHVQALYAKVRLALLCHGPRLVLDGPSIFIDLPLVPQSLLHH